MKRIFKWRIINKSTGEIVEFEDSEKGLFVLHIMNQFIHDGAKFTDLEVTQLEEITA